MRLALPTALVTVLITGPVLAEETRSADAHEHGHGSFNMAVEGDAVAIELETPAFDILGFEHEAKTEADKAAIKTARAALADPVALFGLAPSANCTITEAEIEIGAEADHHDDEHHEDEHHDDEHHAEEDDHKEDDHADHDEEGAEHSEVHAHYALTCGAADKITGVNMTGYFNAFPKAEELDAAILTDAGQASGELEPESPELSF